MIAMVLVGWAFALSGLAHFLACRYVRILEVRIKHNQEQLTSYLSEGAMRFKLEIDKLDARIRHLHTLIDRIGNQVQKYHVQEMDDK